MRHEHPIKIIQQHAGLDHATRTAMDEALEKQNQPNAEGTLTAYRFRLELVKFRVDVEGWYERSIEYIYEFKMTWEES